MECFFVTLALLLLQSTTPSAEMINVESAFIENEILTDLKLDLGPQSLVEITYPSGVSVNLGNILTPTQVKDVPSLKWNYEENTLYTIFMVDPDAPSRKNSTFKEVRHWLVVNVPNNDIKDGDEIVEFIGSGPPQGTGLHRYIFLIFKQPFRIDVTNIKKIPNCSRVGRLSTSVRTFTDEYQFGTPIYGNFYQAEFDDYVPTLHAQLSSGCN